MEKRVISPNSKTKPRSKGVLFHNATCYPNMMVHWLLLDLNSYFASCEQQVEPKLRGKPVGVVPMFAETTSCIAASYEAKAYGVQTGTLVRDARRMCPGIIFVKARHQLYVKLHHEILEAVESCYPISSVLSIDEVACELTGSHQNLQKALALSHTIKKRIYDRVGREMKCSIGLAPNQFLAKVASDMQKPDGLTVLLKENLPQSLYLLKLRDLPGIGAQMEKRLMAHGISTVERLCQLSKREVRNIWGGIWGERFYDWVRGEHVVFEKGHNKSISHQHVLPPHLRNKEGVVKVLNKLLTKAAVRLRKHGLCARHLGVQVKYINPKSYWEAQKTFQETQDSLFLIQTLNGLLTRMPGKQPLRVGIVLSNLTPQAEHQFTFFEDPQRDSLNESIDKINSKYGKDCLLFGASYTEEETPEPKVAFQRVPDLDEF